MYRDVRHFAGEPAANVLGEITRRPNLREDDSLGIEDIRNLLRQPDWVRPWATPASARPDLRHLRPYFFVPLLETSFLGEQQILCAEIVDAWRSAAKAGRPFTEVVVISHGWHRNTFAAFAVYDRLVSRFAVLCARERIKTGNRNPLFVALHWHSDPGRDGFIDLAGRRHRESFLQNVRALFEPRDGVRPELLLSDFEEVFAEMSLLSAPNRPELRDERLESERTRRLERLTQRLKLYRTKDAPDGSGKAVQAAAGGSLLVPTAAEQSLLDAEDDHLPFKVSMLWRCYAEAESKALLKDQTEKPREFGDIWSAISTLIKFIFSVMGVALVPTLLKSLDIKSIVAGLRSFGAWLGIGPGWLGWWPTLAGLAIMSLLVASLLGLGACVVWRRAQGGKPAKGFPLVQTICWLPLQIICLIPILYFLLATFVLRTWAATFGLFAIGVIWLFNHPSVQGGPQISTPEAWTATTLILLLLVAIALAQTRAKIPVGGLFSERLRDVTDRSFDPRLYLSALARFPINWVRIALPPESALHGVLQGIENQLAFFEFQRKGVDAGQDAATFLNHLAGELAKPENNKGVQRQTIDLHLIGHSFGGLVVANALRGLIAPAQEGRNGWLSKRRRLADREIRDMNRALRGVPPLSEGTLMPSSPSDSLGKATVRSLVLLQAAIGSDWFQEKNATEALRSIRDVQGCVACVYSQYDTANGFYYPAANNGRLAAGFVGLTPNAGIPVGTVGKHGELAMLNAPPALPDDPVLNIDGSRLIYEGPVATGGGHDDVFKDDVVHLIWAALSRSLGPTNPGGTP